MCLGAPLSGVTPRRTRVRLWIWWLGPEPAVDPVLGTVPGLCTLSHDAPQDGVGDSSQEWVLMEMPAISGEDRLLEFGIGVRWVLLLRVPWNPGTKSMTRT